MKKEILNEEIDLIQIFTTIWKNKYKIILITLITIGLGLGYFLTTKKSYFVSYKIVPISSFNEESYLTYNAFLDRDVYLDPKGRPDIETAASLLDLESMENFIETEEDLMSKKNLKLSSVFKKIDKYFLHTLFKEKILSRDIIVKAIKKFDEQSNKNFNDQKSYLDNIEGLILKIKLLPPRNVEGKQKNIAIKDNWSIEFKTKDPDRMKKIINYANIETNKIIKNQLIRSFKNQKNTAAILNTYLIEDINNNISRLKNNYQNTTRRKLAFLKEQAEIARELNIEKNRPVTKTYEESFGSYGTDNAFISEVLTTDRYYLRGYNMIDKEIELINSRSNRGEFTMGLFELEEEKKRLLKNEELDRIETLFLDTAIVKSESFKAAYLLLENSELLSQMNLKKTLMLLAIIGLIFGTLLTLMIDAVKKRKY